jgi:hypothetical protein
MTIAEKLRGIADISEQDPADLSRIIWRLDVLRDELRAERDRRDASFIDSLINKPTNLGEAA